MAGSEIQQTLAEQSWIDRAADPVQGVVEPLLHRAPAVADVLHGKWLGHPLHAALTDLPVGAWFTGFVMDMTEVIGGTGKLRRAADTAHTIGLVSALGAAVAGIADWSTTRGNAKRAGFLHGATNVVIAGLYGASLFARARRRRGVGIALSSVGYGLLLVSAWLGGELSYQMGVGVNPRALAQGGASKEGEDEAPLPSSKPRGEAWG